jgi:hypothetical protein
MPADTQGLERLSGDGLPVFYDAGDAAAGDVACAACGYGVSGRACLPRCPMCGGTLWESRTSQPVVAPARRAR